ncbi:MAG: sugar ABC transporter permease [Bifidobacteriaceae bacterium]|jgi:raffinose/stachyose/melibiose transport system permease protein|nr:sugar ABC transporter permease [Bifidobacteriaceae bacterium]
MRRKRRSDWLGYLYLLPAVIFFTAFVVVPAVQTFWYSFWDWNGLTDAVWAGVSNFGRMVTEPLLSGAVIHSVVLLVFFAVLPVILGLLVTMLLGYRGRRGMTVYRTAFFLPQVVALVAIGVIWRWMYSTSGPLEQVLRAIGLHGPQEGWLGNFDTALPAVGLIGTWLLYGVCVTLFLSGAQKIDPDLYNAASVDGAGQFRQFLAVTMPGLRREIALAMTITGIAALASFDLVYTATNGGPGNETTVPGLLVYRLGFTNGRVGAASAVAVGLTLIMAVYVLIINKVSSNGDEE